MKRGKGMDTYKFLHKISRNEKNTIKRNGENQLLKNPVLFSAVVILFISGSMHFSSFKVQAQVILYDNEEVTSQTLDTVGEMPVYVKKQQEAQKLEEEVLTAEDKAEKLVVLSKNEDALLKKYNKNMVKKLTKKEIGILERIVEAEATGEDIYGKILVANVVLNRMNSKKFPNTIEKVVFQKGQFSPILDGRYYSVKVTKKTKESVIRALNGEDYSDGALYFFARKKTTSAKAAWFDNTLVKLFQYKGHDFFKEK